MNNFKRSVTGVYSIDIIKDHIYLLSKNGAFVMDKISLECISSVEAIDFSGGQVFKHQEYDGSVYWIDRFGDGYKFNYHKKEITHISTLVNNYAKGNYIITKHDEDCIRYRVVDQEKNLLWKSKERLFMTYFYKMYLLNREKYDVDGERNTAIQAYDVSTGHLLWKAGIPKKYDTFIEEYINVPPRRMVGSYSNFICVVDGVFWVILGRGWLLGYDVNTGELKHEVDQDKVTLDCGNEYNPYIYNIFNTHYHSGLKSIICPREYGFVAFNLAELKLKIHPITLPTGFEELNITNSQLINEELISFYMSNASMYGIYNIATKKLALLEKYHDESGYETGLKSFHATENQLFFLERYIHGSQGKEGILRTFDYQLKN